MRPVTLLSAGALAAASVCFAIAFARAVTTTSPVADPAERGVVTSAERIGPDAPLDAAATGQPEPASLTLDALMLAVDNDPFQPDRQRPAQRYRLPGGMRDPAPALPPELPAPPPFRVLGTAASGGIGLAVMQVEDAAPRVLGLGESLLGYTLARVEGDTATLVGQGRTLALTVAPPEQRPEPAPDESARGRRTSPRDRRDAELQERRQQAAREQLLERMQRMFEERGALPPGVSFENGRVIIRSRPDTSDAAAPRVRRDPERRP